jgi:hypothetical protein
VRDDPCTCSRELIEFLRRFFAIASWLAVADGTLRLTTDPNPLVAGEKNYTLIFTRDSGDPQDFDNVALLLGGAVVTQFPLNFPDGVLKEGPFSGETDHFTYEPGCVFIHSQHTHDKVYPF